MMKNFLIVGCLFALTSCSVFSPVKTAPQVSYVLDSLPQPDVHARSHGNVLLVARPDTNPVYDTTQIAYTQRPYEVAYYASHVWAESPASLLQPLIVQALQNTRHYHAVVTSAFASNYNYTLTTEILELLEDYTHMPYTVNLSVRARMMNSTTNTIIATKEFTLSEPICVKTPYGGVMATNRAVRRMLQQLVTFSLKHS